jgi:exonuclease VII small subunit
MAISDEVKTKLEDIARHLNISKEEVIESALSIFEEGVKNEKQNDTKFKIATEIMKKASEELRSSNTRLAQRAKIIEEAETDVYEVISRRWGIEI